MYVYCADTYCDSCGEDIARTLRASGEPIALPDDSDHFPQYCGQDDEVDGPDHCASGADCLESLDLGDYGLAPDAPLYGAESRRIGADLTEGLTDHGAEYLAEMLAEEPRTPYQRALFAYWRETFADYLEGGDE